MIERILQGYSTAVVKWRWLVLLLVVLIVGAFCSQVDKVKMSGDYRDFFKSTDPSLQAYELVQNAYSRDTNILVVFAPKNKDIFTAETLGLIEQFTNDAWQLPFARRVDSIANFQHTTAQGDDLTVKNLAKGALQMDAAQLRKVKDIALAEPFLVNKLVSASGHVAGVSIGVLLPEKDDTEKAVAIKALREKLDSYRKTHPDMKIGVSGGLMLDYSFEEQAMNDMETLVPIMYLVILIVMFLAMRSVLSVLASLFSLTFSILLAVGFAGAMGIKFTAVSVSAPTVIMTVAIASCIHLVLAVFQNMAHGQTKHEAISSAMRTVVPILFFVTATDVLGFLSMRISDVPPIGDFGTILAAGAIASFFFSITFIPAILAVLPIKPRKAEKESASNYGKLAHRLIKYRTMTVVVVVVATLIGAYGVTRNQLEDNFVNYFSKSVPFRADSDFAEANLSGVHEVLYSIGAKGPGGISELEYQNNLEKFSSWLRSQPEVFNVTSITDVVKRVNRSMHGDDPAYYKIPQDSNELAQYLLLFEMSLPPGLEMNDQIRVDRSATKLSVVMRNMTSAKLLDFDRKAQAWLKANAPAYMASAGTGPSIMFSRIGELNVEGTLKGYVLQLLLISVVVMLVLRSIKFGLLSVIPNLVPSILAFGLWGYFVGHIGLSVAVVAVMTYGIIVDDTIHTIFKYSYAREKLKLGSDDAIVYVYSQIGPSIFSTTMILVAGFSVLAFSNFDLNKDLGLMTVVTISIAAICDFLIMPAIFSLTEKRGAQSKEATAQT